MRRPSEYPGPQASFGRLLQWHMTMGTRPGLAGRLGARWTRKELADKLRIRDRTVGGWLADEYPPSDLESVEKVLFSTSTDHDDYRLDLRFAHDAFEERAAAAGFDLLPRADGRLVPRAVETERLAAAWRVDANLVSVVGPGGAGKTGVVHLWLDALRRGLPRGVPVLAWSFYKQGVAGSLFDAGPAFLRCGRALGFPTEEHADAPALASALADHLARHRTVVVLDGLEAIQQDQDGPDLGRALDPNLRAFLQRVARCNAGMLVATSRLPVRDGEGCEVVRVSGLPEDEAVALMREVGVRGSEDLLRGVARDLKGHALSLSVLSQLLCERWSGEAAFAPDAMVEFLTSVRCHDLDTRVRRVLASLEEALGLHAPAQLAAVQALSLFDRPVAEELAAQTTFPLFPELAQTIDRRRAVRALQSKDLVSVIHSAEGPALELHPVVRHHFAGSLRESRPDVHRAGNGRLFERFRDRAEASAPQARAWSELNPAVHLPFALVEDGYRAIPHGVAAGRTPDAHRVWTDVLHADDDGRQSRAAAHEADLGAVRALLSDRKGVSSSGPGPVTRLLNRRFYAEKALGLLEASQDTARQAIEHAVATGEPREAAWMGANRAQLLLHLARFHDALLVVEEAELLAARGRVGAGDCTDLLAGLASARVAALAALGRRTDARAAIERLWREDLSLAPGRGLGPMGLLRLAESARALEDDELLRKCAARMAESPRLDEQAIHRGYLALVRAWIALGEGKNPASEVASFLAAAEESRTEQAIVRALALEAFRTASLSPYQAGGPLEAAMARAQSSQMVAVEMELALLGLGNPSIPAVVRTRVAERWREITRWVNYPLIADRVAALGILRDRLPKVS